MIEEHSSAVLTEPLPAAGLEAGDVGVIVHVHRNGEAAAIPLSPRPACGEGQGEGQICYPVYTAKRDRLFIDHGATIPTVIDTSLLQ